MATSLRPSGKALAIFQRIMGLHARNKKSKKVKDIERRIVAEESSRIS